MAKRTPKTAVPPPITEDEALYRGGSKGTVDESTTPTSPGQPLTTSEPTRRALADVVSESRVSLISSSVEYPFFWGDRAVPKEIDSAEFEFGIDIYDRMITETRLSQAFGIFRFSVLSDGLLINPRYPQPKRGATNEAQAKFEKAKEIADYVEYVVKRLGDVDVPIEETLANALECFYKGHKLSEMTADIIPGGAFAGKMGLESFRTKPRENYAFLLQTGTNKFRGVIGKVPGGSIALRTGLVFDSSYIGNAIAPEKLINFTLIDRDGDPRGVSMLRACYDPWYRKQQTKIKHLLSLLQLAGGQVYVILGPEDKGITYINPVTKKRDSFLNCVTAAASMLATGNVAAFPNGCDVRINMPSAAMAGFENAFRLLDDEMTSTLLLSSRVALEAKHGSKADSEASGDTFDELKMFARDRICHRLQAKMFHWLVRCSYDQATADEFCPIASMQKASRPDAAANMTSVSQLATSPWWQTATAEQKDYINTEILGVPAGLEEPSDEPTIPDDEIEDEPAVEPQVGTPTPKIKAVQTPPEGGADVKSAKFRSADVVGEESLPPRRGLRAAKGIDGRRKGQKGGGRGAIKSPR